MYYFKPYSATLTSYAIQLLSWGMGDAMHRWLPDWGFTLRGQRYSINPGPWNAKEHALIVVAYWGSVRGPPSPYQCRPFALTFLRNSATPRTGWARCLLWKCTTARRSMPVGESSSS